MFRTFVFILLITGLSVVCMAASDEGPPKRSEITDQTFISLPMAVACGGVVALCTCVWWVSGWVNKTNTGLKQNTDELTNLRDAMEKESEENKRYRHHMANVLHGMSAKMGVNAPPYQDET